MNGVKFLKNESKNLFSDLDTYKTKINSDLSAAWDNIERVAHAYKARGRSENSQRFIDMQRSLMNIKSMIDALK